MTTNSRELECCRHVERSSIAQSQGVTKREEQSE